MDRIAAAVAAGFDPVAFVDIVRGAMAAGSTAFSTIDAPFRIAAGTAESDRLRLVAEAGTGAGHAAFDIADWLIDIEVGFALAALPDAPPFDVWLTGSPRLPERRLRTDALQAHVAAQAAEALSDRYAPPIEEPPAPPDDSLGGAPGDSSVGSGDPPGSGALLVPAD